MNKVLQQATLALDALQKSGSMSPTELAHAVGIPRPSAYRLIKALTLAGLVEELSDGRAAASPVWMHYGDVALRYMAHQVAATDHLVRLRDETGLTVFLCLPRPGQAVCVERIAGRAYEVLALKAGGSLPLHLGAVGRVLLACGPGTEDYLSAAPFDKVAPKTLSTAAQLREDVKTTLAQGYCVSDEDVTIGVGALGVPIIDDSKTCRGSVSVAGPVELILRDERALATAVKATAYAISEPLRVAD